MLFPTDTFQTVPELNRARRDLFNQAYKRSITPEELDVGYEALFKHAASLNMHYHSQHRSYGPRKLDKDMSLLLNSISYCKQPFQFQQGYERISDLLNQKQISQAEYDMLHTLLMARCDKFGCEFNRVNGKFFAL